MLIIAAIASLMVLVASTSIILYNNPSNFKANAAPALKRGTVYYVDPPPTKVCTSQGCVGNNVNCPVDPSDPTGPTVCKPLTQCDFCKVP
jgi:hypothetical protein